MVRGGCQMSVAFSYVPTKAHLQSERFEAGNRKLDIVFRDTALQDTTKRA